MKIVNLVKLDMLGVETYQAGRIGELINCSQYGLEAEDFEVAMEALSYCILHIAKMNSVEAEAFASVFESMMLKEEFGEPFLSAIRGSVPEMREILQRENERGQVHFRDMSWRMSLVSGCRQRQKMLQPKFTVRLDTEQKPMRSVGLESQAQASSMVFEADFTNMERLQEELLAAVKSIDQQYPRKVQKFIR